MHAQKNSQDYPKIVIAPAADTLGVNVEFVEDPKKQKSINKEEPVASSSNG